MKIKTAGILTAVSIFFFASNANASLLFDIYAGATVGVGAATSFVDGKNHTKSSQSYGAVVGIDIPVLRMELEYDYLNTELAKMHLGMINAYLKMPTALVQPYLGAGIGNIFGGDADGIDLDKELAYQGMLGLTFDIPVLPIKIDAEARVLYAPDIFNMNNIKPDILHYDARVKLRYIF